jgi:uncharacterized protein (TIGR02145 family)
MLLNKYPAPELKSIDYWLVPGTDLSGFNARPAGKHIGNTGQCIDLLGYTAYWSSDPQSGDQAWGFILAYYCWYVQEEGIKKQDAVSVRCILDTCE